ncbi:MAG: polysaccharide biosynthesis tyrosine autokinase, partial [Planctomycetaceae bacterium]
MKTGPGHLNNPESNPSSLAPHSSVDDVDIIQVALRNKVRLILSAVLGLAVGLLAYNTAGPLYQASSRILVSKRESVLDETQDARSRSGERREHLALIMSPVIVDRAIQLGKLQDLPSLRASTNVTEDVLQSLLVKRSAGQDQSVLNVLDVTYTSPRSEDARAVVAAVIEAYGSYLTDSHRSSTREMLQLISKANDDITVQLKTVQDAYLEFCKTTPFLWMNPSGETSNQITDVHQGRIQVLEQERHKVAILKTELESRHILLEQSRKANLAGTTLNAIVTRYRILDVGAQVQQDTSTARNARDAQLLPLLVKEGELLKNYGEDHPEIESIRDRIQTIRDFYRSRGVEPVDDQQTSETKQTIQNVEDYLKYLTHQIAELSQREQRLDDQLQTEMKTAKNVAVFYAQNQAYQEQIQHLKSLQQVIANRAETSNLAKDHAGYRMQRIAPVQHEVVFKRQLMFLGGGTALGLLVTLAATWISQTQDTVIRSIDALVRQVDLPILGGIPFVAHSTHKSDTSNRGLRIADTVGYYHRPNSSEAEAYRSVRTALTRRVQAISVPVVQITSPQQHDGKTLIAANLALAIAQTGRRVLLIDTDLRSPSVHNLFSIHHGVGLTDVLLGEIDNEHAVQPTGIANLSVLAAGMVPSQPAELLSSTRLKHTLDWARTQYECVLLDSSPLLNVSDPCVVGSSADGILLVVRIGQTCRAAVDRAHDLL